MDDSQKSFLHEKQAIIDSLNERSKSCANNSNEYERELSNGLFVATTTFLVLLLSFMGNIKESGILNGVEWLFIISVVFYAFSLIPWIIDYILSIHLFQKNIHTCQSICKKVEQVDNPSVLEYLKKNDIDILYKNNYLYSSKVPRILQITLFIVGLVLSSITIILSILS